MGSVFTMRPMCLKQSKQVQSRRRGGEIREVKKGLSRQIMDGSLGNIKEFEFYFE